MFYFGLLLTEILWRDNSLQFSAELTERSLSKQTLLYLILHSIYNLFIGLQSYVQTNETTPSNVGSCWPTMLRPFTWVRPNFWTDDFLISATRLHRTVQFLLQIAVLFAVQKLARFRGSLVNERRIRASFCPFRKFVRIRCSLHCTICTPVWHSTLKWRSERSFRDL